MDCLETLRGQFVAPVISRRAKLAGGIVLNPLCFTPHRSRSRANRFPFVVGLLFPRFGQATSSRLARGTKDLLGRALPIGSDKAITCGLRTPLNYLKNSYIGAARALSPGKCLRPSSSIIVRRVFSCRNILLTFAPRTTRAPITPVNTCA